MERLFLLLFFFPSILYVRSSSPPNVVIILADDMGFGDVGIYGSKEQPSETPNIDRLASKGIRFTDMHAGSSVCSPARAALLTGRLGQRTGMIYNFAKNSLYGLNRTEMVIPKLLEPAGYDSMAIGKWHLGHAPSYQPQARGFGGGWFGVPYSWDMGCADGENGKDWWDNYCSAAPFRLGCPSWWGDEALCQGAAAMSPGIPLFSNQQIMEQPVNLSTLTSRMDDVAVNFILAHERQSSRSPRPFFLYYACTHMHAPMAHLPVFDNSSTSKSVYGDTLRELDNSVGMVVDTLTEAGIQENTLVVFTSDNGPWNIKCDWRTGDTSAGGPGLSGSQGPFLGSWQLGIGGASGKFTAFEGGHRVPMIMSWPGTIVANTVSHALASHLDMVPTLLALAGLDLPTDRQYDGKDLAPVLFKGNPIHHTALLHPGNSQQQIDAVRVGSMKVFFKTCSAAACGELYYECGHVSNDTRVFDLEADPAESTPLSGVKAQAAIATARSLLDEFQSSLESGYASYTNFEGGSLPDSWACCSVDSLSCRC